jgi:signal transduction histidine kinase
LINGSLDTRYVEVQGIVTAIEEGGLALLTRAGKIHVQLANAELESLRGYENALIRVRGCVIPGRDEKTQQVELGRIALSNYAITVDEGAPADPFTTTAKRVYELLLFDSRAGAFQRVKIEGEVVHGRHGEFFLMQGTNGLRFTPRTAVALDAGDLVEVVGFPDLGGPSPVLREAVARKTSRATLPAPEVLSGENILGRQHDARLVRVACRLANVSFHRSEQVLEMQAGSRGFLARLDARHGLARHLSPGSRLELTGVYAGAGGDPAAGRDIDSFELLLNSPADIRILEQPSWWTIQHALGLLGAMVVVLVAAFVWISLLRRQVEERSRQLSAAVRRQEQAERLQALQEERGRIARDLHDDLGVSLTQIRFLSAVESRDALVPEPSRSRLGQISEKLRQMVASLDEIVWAVNPANDSLPSLATYLCQFAEEFFGATPIRCRLDVDDAFPQKALTSEVRHHVYFAVREAVNNIAKHARATEVWLRIKWRPNTLRIALEDDGRGFPNQPGVASGNGLANMRQRLDKIGGRFECHSRPGGGTVCELFLPLE